jgi:hypothetical protein
MKKLYLLTSSGGWGKEEIKENGRGGEFKYAIFDTL